MSSDPRSDPRMVPAIGDLNTLAPDSDDIILDQSNIKGMAPLHMAMEKALKVDPKLDFPLKAICLFAKEMTVSENFYNNGWGVWKALGIEPVRVMIKARVPEIHSSITMPDVSKPVDQMDQENRKLLALHDTFWGLQKSSGILGYMEGSMQLPEVGDIILIDFQDRVNLRGGIYVGISEKGSGALPEPTWADAMRAFMAQKPTFLGAAAGIPASDGYPVDAAEVEDLCPGPMLASPAFGSELVATVLVDGTPIAVTDKKGRPFAALFMKMRNAALEDGIYVRVGSGFRADDAVDTNAEAALCGLTGASKKGQTTLYKQNCFEPPFSPDPAAKVKCDPPTGAPGGTGGAHRNGYGVDLEGTNPGIPTPLPSPTGPTDMYKWMIDHAHEYGFVRTVAKERWHWEYQPGWSRFTVAADHWSWDHYFTSGEGSLT